MRAAIFQFAPEALSRLLGLPEGAVIDAIEVPFDGAGNLRVRVRGLGADVRLGQRIPQGCVLVHEGEGPQRRIEWRVLAGGE